VRLDESDPVAGWVIGPQIASTFTGYLAERLGEVHTNTMMQVDAVLRAVLRLPYSPDGHGQVEMGDR
jgi:hypothetical protein